MRSWCLAALAAAALLAPAPLVAQRAIPTPASVLGFTPGDDRKLPSWKQVTDYFTALDRASPRVTVRTLGKTTLGRPFIVAMISDPATLANLPKFREIQRKLADPRLRRTGERARLVIDGKVVILVTSSIHSTEVGGFLTPLVLAERLARGTDAETRAILANTIILLVPSQNPDGVDIVGDWYRSTIGTSAEGVQPPELYHKYTGHDNNRDWYAFTQVETQYTVDSLYGQWYPQIVNDIHQQGANAGRIFIPPYMDPIEPNIDPILTAGTNSMGMSMAWRLMADGFTGVATNASYDQWSPARQYPLNHGAVRILTETASARLASPIEMPFASLRTGRGYDARVATWNFPALWPGGTWRIGDIVRYQTEASWALFSQAARDRTRWLDSYATLQERAIAGREASGRSDWPSAIVIPKTQPDTQALERLVRTLQRGQVEVRELTRAVEQDGATYPAGSYVVLTAQPFGGFAKAVLERQAYPNLREYPGGPPKAPYDVTAHTLPLLYGVRVAHIQGDAPATSAPIALRPEPTFTAPGLSDSRARRIAIYRNYNSSMDEGWTRWVFDTYRIPITRIVDREVRAGDLRRRFDVIILPDQRASALERGLGAPYPDSLRGGLGERGAAELAAFVEAGGTLVAFNEASDYAIHALSLPVKDVLEGTKPTEFYAPGSIFTVDLDRDHRLARGMRALPAVWFEDGPAFEITDPSVATAVATYPATGNPLLSGWLLGAERLNGKAALVEVRRGQGRVILFGFRPQYRGQSMATYPLIWEAMK